MGKIAVLYCAVLEDEIGKLVASSSENLLLCIMPQGLHNEPPRLRREVQQEIDRLETDPEIERIVLGYGLCSRGTEGLTTHRATLVIPRAHDCITLLIGDRHRYAEYVAHHPGTYWYSPGWNRHHIPPGERRYLTLLHQYQERFDPDDAEYLMEQEQHWFTSYNRAAFVHHDAGDVPAGRAETQACADWLHWDFDELKGDPALLHQLIFGPWTTDKFVVIPPGQTATFVPDERVMEVCHLL